MSVRWEYFVNVPSYDYFILSEVKLAQGYRPMSVCMHAVPGGDPNDPRYTSVWIRWPDWEQAKEDGTAPDIRAMVTWSATNVGTQAVTETAAFEWLEQEAAAGRFPFRIGAAVQTGTPNYALYTADVGHPLRHALDGGQPMRRSVANLSFGLTDGRSFDEYTTLLQDGVGAYPEFDRRRVT